MGPRALIGQDSTVKLLGSNHDMFLRKQSWVSAFKNSMTVMICKQDKILVESDTTSQHINYKHCNTMLMQCMLLQMYINSNKSGSLKLRKHTSGWIQHAVTTRRDIWRQWWAVHEDNYSNVTTLQSWTLLINDVNKATSKKAKGRQSQGHDRKTTATRSLSMLSELTRRQSCLLSWWLLSKQQLYYLKLRNLTTPLRLQP